MKDLSICIYCNKPISVGQSVTILKDGAAHIECLRAREIPISEVFRRPECIFNYCPHPEHCQNECLKKASTLFYTPSPTEEVNKP